MLVVIGHAKHPLPSVGKPTAYSSPVLGDIAGEQCLRRQCEISIGCDEGRFISPRGVCFSTKILLFRVADPDIQLQRMEHPPWREGSQNRVIRRCFDFAQHDIFVPLGLTTDAASESRVKLVWIMPSRKEENCKLTDAASESRVKFTWTMPSRKEENKVNPRVLRWGFIIP